MNPTQQHPSNHLRYHGNHVATPWQPEDHKHGRVAAWQHLRFLSETNFFPVINEFLVNCTVNETHTTIVHHCEILFSHLAVIFYILNYDQNQLILN